MTRVGSWLKRQAQVIAACRKLGRVRSVPLTNCDCTRYPTLELNNTFLYKRVQESQCLLGKLEFLAAYSDGEQKLFRCPICGQYWQHSRARLWGNNVYLFKVPNVEPEIWLGSPYVSPDEVLEYNKNILGYKKLRTFNETERLCQYEGCTRQAIEFCLRCLQHQMQKLQDIGSLPARPKGLVFEPYAYDEQEMLYTIQGA